jgi:transcriptional regulator with XRE-family HTH domain
MAITDEQIGKNVEILRKGLSQKDVAAAMKRRGYKWSQATMWSVEKGDRPLRLTEAVDLAVIFNVDMDLLFQENAANAFRENMTELERAQRHLIDAMGDYRFQLRGILTNSMEHAFNPEDDKKFLQALGVSPARMFAEYGTDHMKWDIRLTPKLDGLDVSAEETRAAANWDKYAETIKIAWDHDRGLILDTPVKNV